MTEKERDKEMGSDYVARMTRKIAIVGAGFSGAMTAVHLMRGAAQSHQKLELFLIERRPNFGLGTAYSTTHMSHLLNVRASNMSAFADQPDHFLRWLEAKASELPFEVAPDIFVPRKIYGAYIRAVLEETEKQVSGSVRFQKVSDNVVGIKLLENGVSLQTAGAQSLEVDQVVLALGNFAPSNPPIKDPAAYRSSWYVSDPWASHRTHVDGPVLLIGTGLSMVDMVLSLVESGHQSEIIAVSRHGFLPFAHKHFKPRPMPQVNAPASARGLLKFVRAQLRTAAEEGSDWRAVIDSLRPHTQSLWTSLSLPEQRRFLRHLRAYWDVHRHRISSDVTALLENLQKTNKLQVHAGRIESYAQEGSGVKVNVKERGSSKTISIDVKQVINCTGPDSNFSRSQDPLVVSLREQSLLTPHPLGMGYSTHASGALINRKGEVERRLWALGPCRIGNLWESIAVPELRVQAAQLASTLLQELA